MFSNAANNSLPFSEQDLKRALASPEGAQLLAMLRAGNGEALSQAAQAVRSGNYDGIRSALEPVLQNPAEQKLLEKLKANREKPMDQLDEALGKLLNDPGAMAQVMQLAQNLGGALPAPSPAADAPGQSAPAADPMQMLSALRTDERQASLFRALSAYLSPKRREKLERAMQLARLSGLMKAAMQLPDREE